MCMELLNCVTTKKEKNWCLHESPGSAYVLRISDPHPWQAYSSQWVCLRDRGTKGRRGEFSLLPFCSRYSHIICFKQWFSSPFAATQGSIRMMCYSELWVHVEYSFPEVPWVHSGLGKAKSTFGLLHHRADLSRQHGGQHHWDMILK